MAELSSGIIEACCDYLRLSIPKDHRDLRPWYDKFIEERTRAEYDGEERHQFSIKGCLYEEAGDVAIGKGKEHIYLQAAGPIAHQIMEDMQNERYEAGITRIDAKITANPQEGKAAPLPRDFLKHQWTQEAETGLRRRVVNLWESKTEGDTLYLGSPDSASRIRYYHAGVRHPERYPAKAVTWEVQHNKRCAPQVFRMMRSSENMAYCSASLVRGTLDALGIRDWWYDDIPPATPPRKFHKSSKDGTLKWFKQSVRGAFLRSAREEWSEEALLALGIEELTLEHLEALIATLERTCLKHAPKGLVR